ncbi:MAG: glycosyltransferase family 2 protein [Actinomycetota bacterium]
MTIVTPTLNRASLLEGTIESVRAQTYPNIEHIVVDGGSEDDTREVLARYERSDGLRWISEPDEGMYQAVNKGLRLAGGQVLAYLNTDDRYFPYSVRVAVDELLRRKDVGFVYGDMLNVDESTGVGTLVFYPSFDAEYLRRGGLIGQPTVFWRREVTEAFGGFDESLHLAADMEYWMRISSRYPGHRIEEVLAYEGEHETRLTSGEHARERAMAELDEISGRHGRMRSTRGVKRRRLDDARLAFSYRLSGLRFLWRATRPPRGEPGRRWQGFLAAAPSAAFRIDTRRAAIALIPIVGRRFKSFVRAGVER